MWRKHVTRHDVTPWCNPGDKSWAACFLSISAHILFSAPNLYLSRVMVMWASWPIIVDLAVTSCGHMVRHGQSCVFIMPLWFGLSRSSGEADERWATGLEGLKDLTWMAILIKCAYIDFFSLYITALYSLYVIDYLSQYIVPSKSNLSLLSTPSLSES